MKQRENVKVSSDPIENSEAERARKKQSVKRKKPLDTFQVQRSALCKF
jgi:hypothetical protein